MVLKNDFLSSQKFKDLEKSKRNNSIQKILNELINRFRFLNYFF